MGATERPCPGCAAPIPVVSGYPDWCDRCGWNLEEPPTLPSGGGRFARLADALGRRAGERLAGELRAADELRSRWTVAKGIAYAVAAAAHLLTLGLIAGGVAAIVVEFPNPFSIAIGVAMIAAGLVMRPRVPRVRGAAWLDRDAAAELYRLAADVARVLGRPAPHDIVLDSRWNASWAADGWRRRRVLVLGLPLLAGLEPQQRVAVIAHEAGHDRNGDATRSLFLGSAVNGLNALSDLLRPPEERMDARRGLAAFEWLSSGLMWLISRPVDVVLWLEARLLLRDMQRAEYLADALAARVAGTAAVIALHERLLLHPTFQHAVQRVALSEDEHDVLDQVREALSSVPDRERERRRRVARLEHARLDDTHPPTGMRIALLESRPPRAPAVTLDAARSAAIDAELAPFERTLGRELVDRYRGALYYG